MPYGVGMLLYKIVPSVKTVSIKAVFNVKLIKYQKDKPAWYRGVHVITHIIPIVSADGQVKRRIPVPYAKNLGLL